MLQLLDKSEAARILRCSSRTLNTLIYDEVIPVATVAGVHYINWVDICKLQTEAVRRTVAKKSFAKK